MDNFRVGAIETTKEIRAPDPGKPGPHARVEGAARARPQEGRAQRRARADGAGHI